MAILVVVLVTLGFLVAADPANGQDRQRLLSTEEWVNLHEDTRLVVAKTVVDTLGAVGDFTCEKPVVLALSAGRLRLRFLKNDEIRRWFVFALMDELDREHHCRFKDVERLKFLNQKMQDEARQRR